MGIEGLNILIDPDEPPRVSDQTLVELVLIKDHHQGKHTYGNMRRNCPLCVAGK